jgi:hypothetical protein
MKARTKCLVIGMMSVLGAMIWTHRAIAQSPSIQVSYYTPQFYLDYLVFYDQDGTPIYYENDTAYSVPSEYADYNALVTHFQQNADAYSKWFQEVGYANLQYRLPLAYNGYQPLYYLGYLVFYDDSGQPIYYADGTSYPVPSNYSDYNRLASSYRQHRAGYLTWYQARGQRFRWYRQPAGSSYYQPLYYDGYLVYYDDSGLPYWNQGGRPVYIPSTHRLYNTYISHYRTNRANYSRWYASGGNHYQTYRQPAPLRQRVTATNAPRATRGRSVNRTFTPRMRPEARPDRRPEIRPNRRPEPVARPGRGNVDCNREPGHPSCRGRGMRQPQEGRQGRPENPRGKRNPGR